MLSQFIVKGMGFGSLKRLGDLLAAAGRGYQGLYQVLRPVVDGGCLELGELKIRAEGENIVFQRGATPVGRLTAEGELREVNEGLRSQERVWLSIAARTFAQYAGLPPQEQRQRLADQLEVAKTVQVIQEALGESGNPLLVMIGRLAEYLQKREAEAHLNQPSVTIGFRKLDLDWEL